MDLSVSPPTASIPEGKVMKVLRYLDDVRDAAASKKPLPLRFVEELLGVLNWVSSVLVSGRFHLAQIVAARRAAAVHHARCTDLLLEECAWWRRVVTRWNRIAVILPRAMKPSPWQLRDSPVTDAAGGMQGGGGGFYNGLWTAVKWSVEELTELDIMELEALMYVIFLKMLIDRDPAIVSGRRFVARNDNQPWVAAANSNDSSKPAIAVLLGWLHELMVYYSFDVGLEWIASKANPIADALSRGARALFLRSALDAGFAPSALVRVQMPTRSSIVSAMISAKRSARSMQQAQ